MELANSACESHPVRLTSRVRGEQGATADHPRPNGASRCLGRGDYESAIIAGAFCGFAMGATGAESASLLPHTTELMRFAKNSAERRGGDAI
jgi:hypothetical protein